jgi:hypothetical protein
MSRLKFKPNLMHSIKGTRYYYEVTKKVDNTPGFAPNYYIMPVCDIVVKFTDDIVYFQFSDVIVNIITNEELQEIVDFAKKGFIESDFENVIPW